MSSPLPKPAPTKVAPLTLDEMLGQSSLFRGADPETLAEAKELFKEANYKAGEPVFLENEVSNFVYFVKAGKAEILSYDTRLRQLNVVRTIGVGEFFSEMSALTRANHSTSCFAPGDLSLLTMDYQVFTGFLYTKPVIARNLVMLLALLNQKMTQSSSYVEYVKESDFSFNPAFLEVFPLDYLSTFEALPLRLEGTTMTVALTNPYNEEFFKAFKRMNPQFALRVRLVGRTDYTRLFQFISRFYYQQSASSGSTPPPLAVSTPETPDLKKLLTYTSLFSRLDAKIIEKVLPYFHHKEFAAGETIFAAGSKSEHFFLIQSGKVSLQKELGEMGTTQVALLSQNDSFGEISLLLDSLHSLYAVAATTVSAYYLSKKTVTELLKRSEFCVPLARVLAERLQSLNRSLQMRFYPHEFPDLKDLPLQILPKQVISSYKILPLKLAGNDLAVGFVNPEEGLIHQVISRYLSAYRLNLFAIREEDFIRVVRQLGLEKSKTAPPPPKAGAEPQVEVSIANAVQYTVQMIRDAVSRRASDIHVEPGENHIVVRYRVDGMMTERAERLDRTVGLAVTNRIKILCGMDVSEKRMPQDGVLTMETEDGEVSARGSSVPTIFGEKIVLRLAPANQSAPPLNTMAPDKAVVAFLGEIARNHQGVFLITGPTGSGKTTTLYSLLNELNTFDRNIVTVENPVEIVVPGITQININDKIDLSFGRVLRHILRQDPNVVMIGEIRDKESAQFTFEVALTGHLVLSTLHTNNSLDILPRIRELGVGPALLSTGLLGVMAQRLVPKLCMLCREKRECLPEEFEILKRAAGMVAPPREIWGAKGCEKCQKTGFHGRIPVFEYWKNDYTPRQLLLEGASAPVLLQQLKKANFRSLFKFGLQMSLAGLTTIDMVVRFLHGMGETGDT